MTKQDIADAIRDKTGLQKKDILVVIDTFFELVLDNVDKGEKIEFRGFGTFNRTQKKGRMVFSPIANKTVEVPSRSKLVFKASKCTEKSIN